MNFELFKSEIEILNHNDRKIIRNKYIKKFIDTKKHLVLESVHPSPLSAYNGFFGCKHFSKTNEFLKKHGQTPIDWTLD